MKQKRRHIAGMLCAAIAASLFASPVSLEAKSGIDVYRLYNRNTGEHFYTTSQKEKDFLTDRGWNDEGIGWVGANAGDPVYRVYNPNARGGDHYYTMNQKEASYLVSLGWRWENDGKAVFYSNGSVPLRVAYNPNADSGAHNYTPDLVEQTHLLEVGWQHGQIAWYVEDAGDKKREENKYLFENMTSELVFASGMGAWDDTFRINPDGTFEGVNQDSNLGITGPGYPNGTVMYGKYSGQFSVPLKIDDYTYITEVKSLCVSTPTGTEKIIDGQRVQYWDSRFKAGEAFYIYTPGTPIHKIPEEAWYWAVNLSQYRYLPSNMYVMMRKGPNRFPYISLVH